MASTDSVLVNLPVVMPNQNQQQSPERQQQRHQHISQQHQQHQTQQRQNQQQAAAAVAAVAAVQNYGITSSAAAAAATTAAAAAAVAAASSSQDEVLCSICLRSQHDVIEVCLTSCGHSFCRGCLEEALDHGLDGCPMCRSPMSRYNIILQRTGEPLARPEVKSIWGTQFIQGGTPGLASYHFAADGSKAWISYDPNLTFSVWRLDNGSPPPEMKEFQDPTYDHVSRTFTGTISWTPTSFQGHSKWEYRMEFDEGFTRIQAGSVKSFMPNGQIANEIFFGRDLIYRRFRENIYDTVYVQITAFTSYLANYSAMVGKASYHFTRDSSWISYATAPDSWRLDSGERLPLKKYFENTSYDQEARIFRGIIDWSTTPIANAVRWEYEMYFDSSFKKIVDGTVLTIFQDGTHQTKHFGVDMIYVLKD